MYNIKYWHIAFPDIKYELVFTKIVRLTFSAFFQVSSLQNKLKILSCNRRKLIPWKKNKFCKAPLFKKNTTVALINLWILHSQYAGATGKKNLITTMLDYFKDKNLNYKCQSCCCCPHHFSMEKYSCVAGHASLRRKNT